MFYIHTTVSTVVLKEFVRQEEYLLTVYIRKGGESIATLVSAAAQGGTGLPSARSRPAAV